MSARILAIVLVALACRTAAAAPSDIKPPCAGCTLDVPETDRSMALLVVLHGNNEDAPTAAARWREVALASGWAVLSLQCPAAQGCTDGVWYNWNGKPRWVQEQVDKVERTINVDPTRIFLVGWSGGASYIGMNAHGWGGTFAAVVFHGGGQPPIGTNVCPQTKLPAYFLAGDANPMHPTVVRLHEYFTRCKQDVKWDVLAGGNHAAELGALDKHKVLGILGWLDSKSRALLVSER